ncbi:MAG: hypothetical protein ABI972_06010 [Acidobacteriota bacterium]
MSDTLTIEYQQLGLANPASAKNGQSILVLTQLDDQFIDGFLSGLSSGIPSSLKSTLASKITASPVEFMFGYNVGCIYGLGMGLRNLASALVDLFKLAIAFSPPAITYALTREITSLLTDAAHRELRRKQVADARALTSAIAATLADMAVRPADYVALGRDIGRLLGEHAGSAITKDLSARNARQLGEFIGEIAGQIAFEVIIQVLLAAGTEGVGNAARAGMVLGEASQGGGRLAQLATRLRAVMLRLPGLERLMAALGRERQVQGMLRVDAEISRAVEAAFAEGAEFETGVMKLIRVREPGVTLTAEQLAHWRSLRAPAGLPEDFARVWSECGNQAATDGLAQVRRLWELGDDASKLQARRLARVTYNNWRNRFMTRLRQPANSALRLRIESAGFRFPNGPTTMPRLAGGTGEALTLDHSRRLMENPLRCVDPANLEFVIGYENSVTLEQLRNLTSVDMF